MQRPGVLVQHGETADAVFNGLLPQVDDVDIAPGCAHALYEMAQHAFGLAPAAGPGGWN